MCVPSDFEKRMSVPSLFAWLKILELLLVNLTRTGKLLWSVATFAPPPLLVVFRTTLALYAHLLYQRDLRRPGRAHLVSPFITYKVADSKIGEFGFADWTVFMSSMIIFSTLLGIGLGEWKGVSDKTQDVAERQPGRAGGLVVDHRLRKQAQGRRGQGPCRRSPPRRSQDVADKGCGRGGDEVACFAKPQLYTWLMSQRVYLAIDLGAESGRVMAGLWNGKTLRKSLGLRPWPLGRLDALGRAAALG